MVDLFVYLNNRRDGGVDDQSAKFWLDPVALARNVGFAPAELRRIHRLAIENRDLLLEKWNERFPS